MEKKRKRRSREKVRNSLFKKDYSYGKAILSFNGLLGHKAQTFESYGYENEHVSKRCQAREKKQPMPSAEKH